ncbi:unnamed protein product, partial [Hapterophycus canaliculatus]
MAKTPSLVFCPYPTPGTPGIVRRSPLIDALHPEVSRQREFHRKLRETRHQRDAAAATAAATAALVSPGNGSRAEMGSAAERRKHDAGAAATPSVASASIARQAVATEVKVKETAKRCGTDGTAGTTATTELDAKTRSRRRSLWFEPVPLPVTPLSVAPLPSPPSPARKPWRPLPVPSDIKALDDEGPSSFGAVCSDTASLTVLQWGCVDDWLTRARRSLGEKVWTCLGSSSAFSRTLSRLKHFNGPGDSACQKTVGRSAAESLAADPRGIRSGPALEGFELNSPDGLVKSAGAKRRGLRGEGKKIGSTHARKSRARPGSRSNEHITVAKAKIDEREGTAGAWDGGLSEKAALAIDAVMWTIASEQERTTTCGSVCRQSLRGGNDGSPVSYFDENLDAEETKLSSPATAVSAAAAVVELRISLPTARRFIKGSRLVDGVYVLDADVDLAFKKWEEIERLAGPGSLDASSVASPAFVDREAREADGRTVKRNGVGCGSATAALRVPPKQMLCEAVGCSDPARYGDVRPMATASLCRKHRRNGMVDVGSRRCDRPGCGRLAVGGSPNSRKGESAMCTLHAREGRVGAEGLTFVLLALSKARHTRTSEAAEQAVLNRTGGEEGLATESESTALHISAVRNVLLAVTQQPLVPGLPVAGRQQVRCPRAIDEGRRFDSPVHDKRLEESLTSLEFSTGDRQPARPTSATTTTEMDAVARSGRESSAAGTQALTALRVSAALEGQERREKGGERSGSADVCHRGERRLSSSPQQHEIKPGKGDRMWTEERQGGLMPGGRATYGSEHLEHEGRQQGDEGLFASRVGRSQCTSISSRPVAHGDSDSCGDDAHQAQHAEMSPHDRGRSIGGDGRDGTRYLPQSMSSDVGLGGKRGGAARRSGVDEVFGENVTSLRALFHKYSRQPASSGKNREPAMTMTLSGILRFCDAFELRPGLVSTREILDAFKEVAYPGVVGLTDDEVGYSDTAQSVRTSCRRDHLISTFQTGPASRLEAPLRRHSSSSKSRHIGTNVFPTREDCSGKGNDNEKDHRELSVIDETAELDATCIGDHAALKEVALQDLTLKDLASGSSEVARLGETHGDGENGGTTQAIHGELTRMGSDSTRGTFQRESSSNGSFMRGAENRKGTAQQEDDECSLYFKSDSGVEGQHRMPPSSRRASSASSSSRGGVSGRGKRTVYLGRTQVFPLRRVESSLAVDARGFGVSGVCSDSTAGG